MPMHIGMIHLNLSGQRFPPDIRIEKETRALAEAGVDISIFCRLIDDEAEEEQLQPGVTVVRRRFANPSGVGGLWQWWRLRFSPWQAAIEQFIEQRQPDVLHVHDLNLVPTTLAAAHRFGLPVVADFHENMPAAFESWRADQPWWRRLLMSCKYNVPLLKRHEACAVQRCEKVLLVVPEAADRFIAVGFPSEKFVIVSNTEDETTMDIPKPDPVLAEQYRGRWIASYVGGLGPHRGIDTVLRAVPEIVRKVPHFLLLIVGANEKNRQVLDKMVAQYGIDGHVQILGWTPFERCMQLNLISDVCLVPHNDFEHTQTTVPHKLFQYMLCCRPVVVSDCRPLKRIVEEAEAGAVFRANDSHDFAQTIIRLAGDSEGCQRYATGGQKAASTTFAWRNDAAQLVAMYRKIAEVHGWQWAVEPRRRKPATHLTNTSMGSTPGGPVRNIVSASRNG